MEVLTFPLGPLETNCYLLIKDNEAVAVDVGGDPAPLLAALREKKLSLKAVLLTHLHFDHTTGVQALHEATGAPVFASDDDRWMLEDKFGSGGMWGLPQVPPYTFTPLIEGDMTLLGMTCTVIATPGHTPGGLCFYFPDARVVFVGDTLFYRSVGRTDFPRGSTETLFSSIKNGLFTLPDDTVAYPGHGLATTIGEERQHNPFLQGE